jgi:16S rRNA (cytidine1402-2'-O)-methyltransferase
MPGPTAATRAGTLYVVATPIGNLEDITLRALKVLKAVDLVAAEDTRRSAILLRHYDISTPVLSLHEHNERRRSAAIVGRLMAGESVALVTDAGTPAISDPGAHLVTAVRAAGLRIEPIPGPSSIVAALSAAGLDSDGFIFMGFPPTRLKQRKQWLDGVSDESSKRTVVLFESPHRLQSTLRELSLLVKHHILIARELTKMHEELRWGTPGDLASHFEDPRGEFTVVIPPKPVQPAAADAPTDDAIAAEYGHITANEASTSKRQAVRKLADRLGLPVRAVYASLERTKLVKRQNFDV